MAQCLLERIIKPSQIQGNEHNTAKDHAQIKPELLIFQHAVKLTQQKHIVTTEIDAKQQHKNRTYILYIRAVTRYTVILDAKATCSCSAKCRADRIEQRHLSD